MKKSNRSAKLIILVLTAFLVALALPVSAFAAKKEKKIKTEKTYVNGKLVISSSFTYNKNGLETKASYYYKDDDGKETKTNSKSTWTMWKGSKVPKKRVTKEGKGKFVWYFNKKGMVTKQDFKYEDGSREIATLKYKGKTLKSLVWKDSKGNILSKSTFDKYGHTKTLTHYENGKVDFSTTSVNTYKKGVLRKTVVTYNTGSVHTTIYDSKGEMTSYTAKNKDGYVYHTYTSKNTYSGKYLKKAVTTVTDGDQKYTQTTVYTYTSKKYPV